MFFKILKYSFCSFRFRYTGNTAIPDVTLQKPTHVYFGGLLIWMHYGEELRTLYLIDVTYGWYRSWNHIEVTLSFTNMEEIDPTYTGPECVTASFNTCRLETLPELRELVSTSKKEMYHVINTDWDGPAGWFLLTFRTGWTVSFTKLTEDDIYNSITQNDAIAELIGDIVNNTKTDEELLAFIKQKDLTKHIWIVDVDLRSWSSMSQN